jgi:hypothetical protein
LRGLILLLAENKSNTLSSKNDIHGAGAHLIANKTIKPA